MNEERKELIPSSGSRFPFKTAEEEAIRAMSQKRQNLERSQRLECDFENDTARLNWIFANPKRFYEMQLFSRVALDVVAGDEIYPENTQKQP